MRYYWYVGIILPIDFHMFQDGYCTTNQIWLHGLWILNQRDRGCLPWTSVDFSSRWSLFCVSILATRRSLGLQVAFSCLFCFMIMTDLVWSLFRATKRWATKRFQIRHEQPTQSTSSMGKSSDQAGCVFGPCCIQYHGPVRQRRTDERPIQGALKTWTRVLSVLPCKRGYHTLLL